MDSCMLSIVIPVYNVEKYLEECYQSIETQITDECEVIFVDDGSTDSSGIICENICNKDSHIKVIHKKNGGLSDARNEGIKHSNGNYIMFIDSDDMLSSQGINAILSNIKEFHPDILMGRSKVFSDIGKDTDKFNIGSYSKYQYIQDPCEVLIELDKNVEFWFAAWLIIIRRELLVKKGLYFEKGILHEDERWVPLVFANAESVRLFDEAFYLYRTNREGSIVSAPKIKREFDKIATAEFFSEFKIDKIKARELLQRRAAALIFGVILSLQNYRYMEEYNTLVNRIKCNLPILSYGKYRPIALLCRVFGIDITSRMLSVYMK